MPGIESAIDALKEKDKEDAVSRVWITLLGWLFLAMEGYSIGCEINLNSDKRGAGRADIVVEQSAKRDRDNRYLRTKFAVVECKRPDRAHSNRPWGAAEN